MAELEHWIGQLPQRLPLTRARMLSARLKALLEEDGKVRVRLKMLELIDDATLRLCSEIEAQLNMASLPLTRRIQHPLVATAGLLKLLSGAYLALAEQLSRRWVRFTVTRPLRIAIERGTVLAAHRLSLTHRAYTIGNSSSWRHLYAFHRLARQHGFADERPNKSGLALSPAEHYAQAVLLSAADPTAIALGDLDRLRFYLQRHVRYTRFMRVGNDGDALQAQAHGLYVLTDSTRPPVALSRHRAPLQPGQHLLDCREMLAKLQGQIDGLRLGVVPARLGLPIAARQRRYVRMLESLHEHWAHPRSRSHGRTRFLPRADLVTGFDAIRPFLAGPALQRRKGEAAPAGQSTPSERASEWGIVDESPGGFGLRYQRGQTDYIQVGEVVALQPHERAAVLIGVIRRMVNRKDSEFDMGVEILAASAIATQVVLPAGPLEQRPQVPVLLLPKLPAFEARPGLLAPIGEIPPGTRIALQQHGQRLTLKTGVPLERLAGVEIIPLARSEP
ncbi:hypothetical protein [Denitromonas iodatirespirans]|uniref:PilZ domain-containing protein n=1 Tax=Denitromonas iodatirespirans TaxID=2795389 RepID=A0A944DBC4_DENI1|nr:hypothetical protein [Denitromonas iodatirespirans]MBT0963630.1 hypothetical protein [Denitromonas iodatirespirans]